MMAESQSRRLEFWYEFASTYSYLSAMRIEALAATAGIEVVWRPFLLGPIFKAQGWDTSPFSLYPAKGRYMIRDMKRICHDRGLNFTMPDPFPQPSLRAARIATALPPEHVPTFSRRVFELEFAAGRRIDDERALALILSQLDLDSTHVLAAADGDACKQAVRARVAEAERRGIFGAPSFLIGDQDLFWGDDRLDMAISAVLRL